MSHLISIDYKLIQEISYRYPNTIVKNNNIFNNNTKDLKILYNLNIEYFILKPKGKRSILWFTYYKKEILCILILLNTNQIFSEQNNYYKFDISFNNQLCYNNLVLFGYYFNQKNNHYFIIENIYNFNIFNNFINDNDLNNCYKSRLILFKKIFDYCDLTNKNFNIRIPLILENLTDIFKTIYNINYRLYSISLYSRNKYLGNYILNNDKNNNNKIVAVFKITANVSDDIYNLYIMDNNTEVFYDYALINTYKLSKYMNKLFRKIKENDNLDYLLESDQEEEFENIDTFKFIQSNKCYNLECIYNEKFKKWIPDKISEKKLIDKKQLIQLIKKKKYLYNI